MRIISFSYNNMQDRELDCSILDARELPYPLGSESGQDTKIQDQVMLEEKAKEMVKVALSILKAEGDIAFGCGGGYQRSVALAEETSKQAQVLGLEVEVEHKGLYV